MLCFQTTFFCCNVTVADSIRYVCKLGCYNISDSFGQLRYERESLQRFIMLLFLSSITRASVLMFSTTAFHNTLISNKLIVHNIALVMKIIPNKVEAEWTARLWSTHSAVGVFSSWMNQYFECSLFEWMMQWLTHECSHLFCSWMNQCYWTHWLNEWFNDSLIKTRVSFLNE